MPIPGLAGRETSAAPRAPSTRRSRPRPSRQHEPRLVWMRHSRCEQGRCDGRPVRSGWLRRLRRGRHCRQLCPPRSAPRDAAVATVETKRRASAAASMATMGSGRGDIRSGGPVGCLSVVSRGRAPTPAGTGTPCPRARGHGGAASAHSVRAGTTAMAVTGAAAGRPRHPPRAGGLPVRRRAPHRPPAAPPGTGPPPVAPASDGHSNPAGGQDDGRRTLRHGGRLHGGGRPRSTPRGRPAAVGGTAAGRPAAVARPRPPPGGPAATYGGAPPKK